MIQIQIASIKDMPAILAGVVVALENVVPGELHFLLRQPIKKQKHNNARHADLPRDRRDHLVFGPGGGKIAPAIKVVCEKIVLLIGWNDLGMTRVDQGEGTTRRADVHRLPEAVQDENLTI